CVQGNPQHALKDKGVIDSGFLRHMTGNMSYQSDFKELNGGYVAFGGNPKGGKISGKGKIKTGSHLESLDQIHDRLQKLVSQLEIHGVSFSQEDVNLNLKIYEAEVKHSSTGTTTQNLAFVSSFHTDSTTESISAAASVFAVCAKMPVSSLPNVESLSNAVIYSFFVSQSTSSKLDNKDLKQIHDEILELMDLHLWVLICLKWSAITATGRDILKGSVEEEPANYAFMDFLSSSSSSDNEVPTSDRYHAVTLPYTRTFVPPKPDLVFNTAPTAIETDHPAFTVQLSTTKPKQDLSYINRPTTPIIKDWVSDSEDESETKASQIVPTATPKPASPKCASSGKRRNRKACFACKSVDNLIKDCDYHAKKMAQPTPKNYAHRVLTQSKLVSITSVRPVSAAVLLIKVTQPRHANQIVTMSNSPIRRRITRSLSRMTSNLPPRVTVVKAPVDKGVIDSGCSKHMTWNMCYLSNFEELNGGYVAFGGNQRVVRFIEKEKSRQNNVLFTNTECLVLSLDFKLPDESQVLLRVPRENNIYIVNLKNIVPFGDLPCVFAKATIDESNLWHRRLGHINFKTINKLVKCNHVRGLPTKAFENDNTCVACKKGKQHRASCKTKPVSSIDQPLYRLHMDLFGPTSVKSLNKKSYCLVVTNDYSRTPSIGFMRPFGYLVAILNTLDSLGKFNGKVDKGFLVGYSINSTGPTWLFDIDSLTMTMNYQPVTARNQSNPSVGFQDKFDEEKKGEEIDQPYVLFPVWSSGSINPQKNDRDDAFDEKEPDIDVKKPESEVNVSPSSSAQSMKQDDKTKKESFPTVGHNSPNNTNTFSVAGPSNAAASPTYGKSLFINASQLSDDYDMLELEDITYSDDEDDVGAEADCNILETSITVSHIPTTTAYKDHPISQIIGDLSSITQTRSMTRVVKDLGGLSQIFNDDFHTCMFACFLSQKEPKREVRIDYEEVFAPVARIEAIVLFLAYASFMGFMLYQMDVKSAFLNGTIEEEVYVCQPLGFGDPDYPDKVYKVVKIYVDDIIFGATNKDLCKYFEKLTKDKFRMSSMGNSHFFSLQVKQKKDGIFISQDKYVAKILRKFGLTEGKSASTPIDTEKPLLKDSDSEDVDVHTYMSMIGPLMYLTSSRLDIMFASWIVQQQTTLGKDKSNPLTVDSLLETIWSSIHHLLINEVLTIPGQAGTGVNTPRSDEDRIELMELMVFLLPKVEKVRIGVNGVDLQVFVVSYTLLLFSLMNWCCSLSAVRSVDSTTKFYMYPYFLKLIIRKQVGDLSTHTTKYTSPTLNQKIFANMRIVGKGISGVETPLFEGMFVEQEVDEEVDADENVEEVNAGDAAHGDVSAAHGEVPAVAEEQSILSPTPPTPPPQPPQDIPSTPQRVEAFDDIVMDDESNQWRMIAEMDQYNVVVLEDDKKEDREVVDAVKDVEKVKEDKTEPAEFQEVVDVVTTAKLITKVFTATSEIISTASVIITTAEAQVPAATHTASHVRVVAAPSRRRKEVVIQDPKEESTTSTIIPAKTKSKNKGNGILVEEPKPFKKKQQIKLDEQYARELHAKLNKDIDWDEAIDNVKRKAKEDPANVAGFKMDYFKGMYYDDIHPIFEAKFNLNVAFLLKTKEQIEEDENRALQKLNETLAERAAKRKKWMRRADDTHQLYISFMSLPRNFDKEDLEALLSLVKEIFSTTKPKNFFDDFLLVTLGLMFKKPDIHALIWKTQRNEHVPTKGKGWKLLESCGVLIITFTSTQLILLVKRKYPLIRFIVDQMLNAVRLKVEEESEVSLELLRFT
nr:ribonuclease H-like domain-containing protein [Tanacetum cinerariifolium]